jgi:hypothetical protein
MPREELAIACAYCDKALTIETSVASAPPGWTSKVAFCSNDHSAKHWKDVYHAYGNKFPASEHELIEASILDRVRSAVANEKVETVQLPNGKTATFNPAKIADTMVRLITSHPATAGPNISSTDYAPFIWARVREFVGGSADSIKNVDSFYKDVLSKALMDEINSMNRTASNLPNALKGKKPSDADVREMMTGIAVMIARAVGMRPLNRGGIPLNIAQASIDTRRWLRPVMIAAESLAVNFVFNFLYTIPIPQTV